MENHNNNHGQQWCNFPAVNNYQYPTPINMQHEPVSILNQYPNDLAYFTPEPGSGVGWADHGHPMMTTPELVGFRNPGQWMQQQQIVSFSGNGMYRTAPESALMPMPMLFLIGEKKYKKGDWKSISRHMVVTRSPTQVASHAQKYYIRQKAEAEAQALVAPDGPTRKKRSSIHDTKLEQVPENPNKIKSLQDTIIAQHSKSGPRQ